MTIIISYGLRWRHPTEVQNPKTQSNGKDRKVAKNWFSKYHGDSSYTVVVLQETHQHICLTCSLLSADNVFRYSNKVITKLPDIFRFIAVFCYYRQRNIQRFCPINHREREIQTLLCLAHCHHFWIRNKLLAHFHKWKRKPTAGATAWLSQESVYQWMDFLIVATAWGPIPISSYWLWQCTEMLLHSVISVSSLLSPCMCLSASLPVLDYDFFGKKNTL